MSPQSASLTFDPYSAEFFTDPYPTYRRLRDEAPVYHDDASGFYALSRHQDVSAAMRDFESFSSSRGITLDLALAGNVVPGHILQMMDPPEHRRMRGLVNKVFTPRAIASLEPMVRETIRGYLSRCDDKGFDVVTDFAVYFPVEIIATMLGVPAADRQQIRIWQDEILHRGAGRTGIDEAGLRAIAETRSYYLDLISSRRSRPHDDMISALTTVEVGRADGSSARLDDDEIAGLCTQLGAAGAETVTKLIGSAAVVLAQHPEQWRRLQDDRGSIPAAVEEVLRYDGPVQYNCRFTLREVTLHGVTIPVRSAVMLLVASANRDDRAFSAADTFDVDRDRSEAQALGFGYGVHSCLGAALARLESTVALDCLLDALPEFEVDPDDLKRVSMTNVNGYASVPVTPRHRS